MLLRDESVVLAFRLSDGEQTRQVSRLKSTIGKPIVKGKSKLTLTDSLDLVEPTHCGVPGTIRIRLWVDCTVEVIDFPCDQIPAAVRSVANCGCSDKSELLKSTAETLLQWIYLEHPDDDKSLPDSTFAWKHLTYEVKNFLLYVKSNLRDIALRIKYAKKEDYSQRSQLWASIILGENPIHRTLPMELADVHLRLAAIYFGKLSSMERIEEIEKLSESVPSERLLSVLQQDLIRKVGVENEVRTVRVFLIYVCSHFESIRRMAIDELSLLLWTLFDRDPSIPIGLKKILPWLEKVRSDDLNRIFIPEVRPHFFKQLLALIWGKDAGSIHDRIKAATIASNLHYVDALDATVELYQETHPRFQKTVSSAIARLITRIGKSANADQLIESIKRAHDIFCGGNRHGQPVTMLIPDALKRIGTNNAVRCLEWLYERDSDTLFRTACLEALGFVGDTETVEFFKRIALTCHEESLCQAINDSMMSLTGGFASHGAPGTTRWIVGI